MGNSATRYAKVLFVCAFGLAISLALPAPLVEVAQAGTIYDSNVVNRLKLKGSQRTKAKRVIRESDREMRAVFRKYKINPNARPDFAKLQQAARELHAIERDEVNKMSKILDEKQFAQYKKILAETSARVRAAAK